MYQHLLEALLDSWDRSNAILLNLLRALPEGGLEAKAIESSPSVAELFTHIHYVRLVSVFEDAPEFARNVPEEEWVVERDRDRIAQMLNDSAKAVRLRLLDLRVKYAIEGSHGMVRRPQRPYQR